MNVAGPPLSNPTTPKRSCGQVEIWTLNIMRRSDRRNYIPDIPARQSDFGSMCAEQLLIKQHVGCCGWTKIQNASSSSNQPRCHHVAVGVGYCTKKELIYHIVILLFHIVGHLQVLTSPWEHFGVVRLRIWRPWGWETLHTHGQQPAPNERECTSLHEDYGNEWNCQTVELSL